MSYQSIQTILDTQLLTVISADELQLENVRRETAGTGFYRSTLLPSQTQIATLGVNGYDKLNGMYQIDVFVKIGTGATAANTKADTIMAAFIKGNYLSDVSIDVLVENKWRLPARTLQNFYQIPVIVQWSVYKK